MKHAEQLLKSLGSSPFIITSAQSQVRYKLFCAPHRMPKVEKKMSSMGGCGPASQVIRGVRANDAAARVCRHHLLRSRPAVLVHGVARSTVPSGGFLPG